MDLSAVLTFDTLALCLIGLAVARELWIRLYPLAETNLTARECDALAHEDRLDRQFDMPFAKMSAQGGSVAAKHLTLAQVRVIKGGGPLKGKRNAA